MERNNFSKNLVYLRKEMGLTQGQLAQELSYSDKTISKWENGDALPDTQTLHSISVFFGVSMDLLYAGDVCKEKKAQETEVKKEKWNKSTITLLAVCFVWFVAVFSYVCVKIITGQAIWMVFIYALPASFIVLLIYNVVWGKAVFNYFIISFLIWTTLLSIHLQFLSTVNVWPVYILGVPLQVVTILWSQLKKKTTEKDKDKEE